MTDQATLIQIQEFINEHPVVLYMKGTAEMPQCGFSSVAVTCLRNLNVDFVGFNILADQEVREEVKAFSNWPTIPQLYINKQFVGGSDIVKEMYSSGELKKMLES